LPDRLLTYLLRTDRWAFCNFCYSQTVSQLVSQSGNRRFTSCNSTLLDY